MDYGSNEFNVQSPTVAAAQPSIVGAVSSTWAYPVHKLNLKARV
jgi:hypothetical protein